VPYDAGGSNDDSHRHIRAHGQRRPLPDIAKERRHSQRAQNQADDAADEPDQRPCERGGA
jgi:hypothetical protein